MNFKLAHNKKVRTNKTFKSLNVRKMNKTFDSLGCSLEFFKKWIFYQLYGDMTIEIYGKIWCLDHCYPLAKCNLIDKKDLYRYNNWVNERPMFIIENSSKGLKLIIDYIYSSRSKQNFFQN